jgi:hypothetical protein
MRLSGDGDRVVPRRAVIAAQRRKLSELRREHRYPADMLRQIERDLDLDEARLR